jgi:4-hydroxybenzoate polyprenyltransferase
MPVAVLTREIGPTRSLVSASGMAIVALVCALCGLTYGLNRLPSSADLVAIIYVVSYAFLVYPYFYSRYATLEGEPLSKENLNLKGRFIPSLLFVIFALVVLVAFLCLSLFRLADSPWHDTPLLLLAISPFVALGIGTQQTLKRGADIGNQRTFQRKVFLPAFATCLMSFSFGWALTHSGESLLRLLVPIGIVGILSFVVTKGWHWIIAFVGATIGIPFLIAPILESDNAIVILTGAILTFAMGVAEVCKRVVRINRGDQYVAAGGATGEDAGFYLAGSNWASIIFPLCLCFLPLLNFQLDVRPIFIILSIQYLHWHFWAPKKRSRCLSGANVVFGFSLPLALILQHVYAFPASPFQRIPFLNLVGFLAFVAASFALFTPNLSSRFSKLTSEMDKRSTFLSYDSCFLFFLLTVGAVTMVIALLTLVLNESLPYDIEPKASETVTYLIALTVVAISFYFLRRRRMVGPLSGDGNGGGGSMEAEHPAKAAVKRAYLLLFQVARVPVALIAGLPVAIALLIKTNASWTTVVASFLPIVAITMSGFILNDVYDVEKDKPFAYRKPIASGWVDISTATAFAWALCFGALTLAAFSLDTGAIYVSGGAIVGVAIYSRLARRLPALKGFMTALLCCVPFLYAAQVAHISYSMKYYAFLFAFIVGRELLLDVRDIASDSSIHMGTIATRLRTPISRTVGWSLMIGSLIAVMVSASGTEFWLFVAALASLIPCLSIYVYNENRGIAWSRLTLLIGALAASVSV